MLTSCRTRAYAASTRSGNAPLPLSAAVRDPGRSDGLELFGRMSGWNPLAFAP